MAVGSLIPFVKSQWFTDAGAPAAGYQLFVYLTGTSTKASLYSDADLTVAQTNPVVLDSAGRADVFIGSGYMDYVLAPPTDTDPPTSPVWTTSDVSQVPPPYTGITILASGYSGASTNTTSVDVSLLADNDSAVCTWRTDYSSATLSARATVAAVNYDLGVGSNSTYTKAECVLTRLSSTSLDVELSVWQDGTVAYKGSRTTATVADMNSNAVTVTLGMASGTYTIRAYSILHVPTP